MSTPESDARGLHKNIRRLLSDLITPQASVSCCQRLHLLVVSLHVAIPSQKWGASSLADEDSIETKVCQ